MRDKIMFLQKCKSLRFEDRKKCLSDAREDSWFCAHHGEVAVCLALNRQWFELINPENNYVDIHEENDAIYEVEEYMHKFKMSILHGKCENMQYWWNQKNEKKKRVRGNCYSLKLKTGDLCNSRTAGRERFCPYHKVQHRLLCTAYHLTTDMTMYGVSDNTRAFVEFVLRKEFSLIFIGDEDLGHKERRGWLLNRMFQDPYPEVNRLAIDTNLYEAEKRAYIAGLRGMQRSIVYDNQEEEQDHSEQNCVLSEQPAVTKAETEKVIETETEDPDWDLDLE